MTKFFTIDHVEKRGTPYASKIISDDVVYFDACLECGRSQFNHSNRDLALVVEGKRTLPDYLLCGHYPLKIVSQRVIDAWQKNDITGYTAFPIRNLIDAKGNEIHLDYKCFCVTITGRVELDLERMGVFIRKQCSACGALDYSKETWEWDLVSVNGSTHDGSHLFVAKHFESVPICTIKVLEVVYKENLTNFQFRTYESMFSMLTSPVIDLKSIFQSKT